MGNELKLDDGALRQIAGAAILTALDQGTRDKLVQGALENLMKPNDSNSYPYDRLSVLERAFHSAIADVAREIIDAEVKKDETVKERVKQLVADAWLKLDASTAERDKLVTAMATAIATALVPDRR